MASQALIVDLDVTGERGQSPQPKLTPLLELMERSVAGLGLLDSTFMAVEDGHWYTNSIVLGMSY